MENIKIKIFDKYCQIAKEAVKLLNELDDEIKEHVMWDDQEFSTVQYNEIEKGLKSGMSYQDVKIYAHPEISSGSMMLLRMCIQDNAKKEITEFMHKNSFENKKVLEEKIIILNALSNIKENISPYLSDKLSPERMKNIFIHNMEIETDLKRQKSLAADENVINKYSIYKMKEETDFEKKYAFCAYNDIKMDNMENEINVHNYELGYCSQIINEKYTDPEVIFENLNISHPDDYHMHSLSLGDVIVVNYNDTEKIYFVDSIGFKEIPDFMQKEREIKPINIKNDEVMEGANIYYYLSIVTSGDQFIQNFGANADINNIITSYKTEILKSGIAGDKHKVIISIGGDYDFTVLKDKILNSVDLLKYSILDKSNSEKLVKDSKTILSSIGGLKCTDVMKVFSETYNEAIENKDSRLIGLINDFASLDKSLISEKNIARR